ncbi:MAG: hypothetical protein KC422_07070 [Trueperaceae bacterium]|nr:hypothetical protein [Trueperaceae bacterium]
MEAHEFDIIAKNRSPSAAPARLSDFDVRKIATVAAKTLVSNPNISLYCLEHKTQLAVFVETPSEIDIYSFPFLYAAQYEHATKLYTLPLDIFHQLAQNLPEPRVIMLFSLGRSGSTLLGKAFNELENVFTLSEPDVFANLTGLRNAPLTDEEEIRLAQSCLRFLCKSPLHGHPGTWLIKFRGFAISIADIIHRAAPTASNIFLYRDLEAWLQSMARLTRLLERGGLEPKPLQERLGDYQLENALTYLKYMNPRPKTLSMLESFTLSWLSMMNRYLELVSHIPFVALRYQDLVALPGMMLPILFEHCQLGRVNAEIALNVFEQDSQEGTRFSGKANRELKHLELTQEHLQIVQDFIQIHPLLKNPDFILPKTIMPS